MKRRILLLAIILLAVAAVSLTACSGGVGNSKEPIGIVAELSNIEYFYGQDLDLSDARIIVSYADGFTKPIDLTPDMISGYNPKQEGVQKVTVTYMGLSTEIEIFVKPITIQRIEAVEINSETGKVSPARPLKVIEGGQPDYTRISLRIHYESMSVLLHNIRPEMISGYSVAACPPRPEPYELTVTYEGKTAPILLYVERKAIQQIIVESDGMPQKQVYKYNNPEFINKIERFNQGKPEGDRIVIEERGARFTEVFDPTGLKLTLLYNNGDKEVVNYSQIEPGDIQFEYNFNRASAQTPVRIIYREREVVIYVKVIESLTTGMEITKMPSTRGRYSFVSQDASLPAPEGTVVELPVYSPSDSQKHYIVRTPEPDLRSLIVVGDTIEWATGKARIFYDDGTILGNVPLDFNDIMKTSPDFASLNTALNKTGRFTIRIYYSNSTWAPIEVSIEIVQRKAIMVFLAEEGINRILGRVYYTGDEIDPQLVKYNAFFDNGTFLFRDVSEEELADPRNYVGGQLIVGEITEEIWRDPANWIVDADGNISFKFAKSGYAGTGWEHLNETMLGDDYSLVCSQPGQHIVRFALDGAESRPVTVDVNPLLVTDMRLIQDFSYYFEVGENTGGFFERDLRANVLVYLWYNNGAYVIKQLTPSAARIYKDGVQLYAFSDSQPYQFTQAGEYEIRVYEGEAYDSLPLFVTEREAQPKVTAVSIAGKPPRAEFDHFSVFEESYEYFNFLVTYSDGSQKTLLIGSGAPSGNIIYANVKYSGEPRTEDDILVLCDRNRIGNQVVTFRYRGQSATYSMRIIGRWEKSIQIIKLPKQLYIYGTDTTIDLMGLKVRILYNDDTVVEETDFSDPKWSFVFPNMSLLSDQFYAQKTVTVILDGQYQKLKRDYTIELVKGEIVSIEYDEDQRIVVGQEGGQPVYEYLLKEHEDQDGVVRKMLTVRYGEDLDLTSFVLLVTYRYVDGTGTIRTATVERGITSANVNYDKKVDYKDAEGNIIYTRELEINYCGKTIPVWLYLDPQKTLIDIEIIKDPDQLYYAVGQNIDLRGGLIRRKYELYDGSISYDFIYMTNPEVSVTYNRDPFPVGSAIASEIRTVTISYKGFTDSFTVTTYKKLKAELEYRDIAFRYGQNLTPVISALPSGIPGFEIPQITWSFGIQQAVNGVQTTVWVPERPLTPGIYPIKVTVHENEYYEGYEEISHNLTIMQKIIEIYGKDFEKYYSFPDPDFNMPDPNDPTVKGYYYLGYSGTDTPLVGNDRIEIRLLRKGIEAGNDVRYDASNAILGYTIDFELVEGDNQNDYYIIVFTQGKLTIKPLPILGNITFTGLLDLVADGQEKPITAYYLGAGNAIIEIAQKDIIYIDKATGEIVQKPLDINGEIVMVNCPPKDAGTYIATISRNYIIDGVSSVEFTINSPQ